VRKKNYLNCDYIFRGVKGIAYLSTKNEFIFTGYGARPISEEIEYPDYSILENDGSINHFLPHYSAFRNHEHASDRHTAASDSFTKHRSATVVAAKGCVARCTFCHRWEKGYRVKAVDDVIDHIKMLASKYGVNSLRIGDENFGADRKLTRELVTELGKLNIYWSVSGVRAKTVNQDDLNLWAQNGCLAAHFGIETGSPKMLEVMEKHTTLEENINAMKFVGNAGISTVIQLVIGMPGENDVTIHETIDFLKEVAPYMIDWKNEIPSNLISINYAQALPGTPLYELLRENEKIGKTLDEEEKYLIKISDTNAYSTDHYINVTNLPDLKVFMWRQIMLSELDAHFYRITQGKNSMPLMEVVEYFLNLAFAMLKRKFKLESKNSINNSLINLKKSGYFNISEAPKLAPLLLNRFTKLLFKPTVAIAVGIIQYPSKSKGFKLIFEYLLWSAGLIKISGIEIPSASLRKIIKIENKFDDNASLDEKNMQPLRLGR
jgi:radical SAM superfamily enzyme YgiQ (UPF0313 family)